MGGDEDEEEEEQEEGVLSFSKGCFSHWLSKGSETFTHTMREREREREREEWKTSAILMWRDLEMLGKHLCHLSVSRKLQSRQKSQGGGSGFFLFCLALDTSLSV
jgi:hypothetical protein